MSVARVYAMSSQERDADALEAALLQLASGIGGIGGCESVEVLRDQESPGRFLFLEHWTSKESHSAGSEQIPAAQMKAVHDLLVGKPEAGCYAHCE